MTIKLYNTAIGKKEIFKPIKEGQVGIYSCGPTVYWNQHIGHMYAYILWDVLVRFLRTNGFTVKWVMNITDVGHLTSDGDSGDDKMEKGAARENLTPWQVAEKYTKQFLESLKLLNVQQPDVLPRATEHIKEQIQLAQQIEKNGFAYKTSTGLVFDTGKFKDYAKFANLKLDEQAAGARVEIDRQKKNPWDFLLWVTNQPNHIMQWDSPWGKGFPGWHIECTAMSTKYLGEKFDIHTGGIEHIKVHHTNEIAQAHGAFGQKQVNYWLHNGWLTLKGRKMSKSKGNMLLITDLLAAGFSPMHFRYLVLTSHYRKGLVYEPAALAGAKIAYDRLVSMMQNWRQQPGEREINQEKLAKLEEIRNNFNQSLSDDLNTAKALAVVWGLAKSNLPSRDKLELIEEFDRVLGLQLVNLAKAKPVSVPLKVKKLAQDRKTCRQKGEYDQADQLRQKIDRLGWYLEDLPGNDYLLKPKE